MWPAASAVRHCRNGAAPAFRALERERGEAAVTKMARASEASTVAKRWRSVCAGAPCRGCTGGGEIHPTAKVAFWGTKQGTRVSVRCATTRGVERSKREVTGLAELTGIDGG